MYVYCFIFGIWRLYASLLIYKRKIVSMFKNWRGGIGGSIEYLANIRQDYIITLIGGLTKFWFWCIVCCCSFKTETTFCQGKEILKYRLSFPSANYAEALRPVALENLTMNTRKSATIASYALVLVMVLGALVQSAYADMVVGTTIEAAAPSGTVKVKLCKSARCERKAMDAMADIIVKAKDKPVSGLTWDNCAKAQPKFVRLAQQLNPATLDAFMKKNAWVGECAFYVPPSVNF
jgi:hypothetical protein